MNDKQWLFKATKIETRFFLKFWSLSGAKVYTSCRSPKMLECFWLSTSIWLQHIRVDTAENEPLKIRGDLFSLYSVASSHIYPASLCSFAFPWAALCLAFPWGYQCWKGSCAWISLRMLSGRIFFRIRSLDIFFYRTDFFLSERASLSLFLL